MQNETNTETEMRSKDLPIVTAVDSLHRALTALQSLGEQDVRRGRHQGSQLLPSEGLDFKEAVQRYEKSLIKQALRLTNGHQTNAAKLLRMNLSTLNAIIKRYQIETR